MQWYWWVLLASFLRPAVEILVVALGEWWFHTGFRENPARFTRLIVQVTTVGHEPERVAEILRDIAGAGLSMPYETWVVTEPGAGDSYPLADRVITVPREFAVSARHKARALEYSRRIRQHDGLARDDVKILFLDDDTSPTPAYVETAFAADYDLAQGAIATRNSYGSLPLRHFFLSHMDDMRLAEGGRMEITGGAFRYLGRDWSGSYGVSWAKGAGGFADGARFERGFMGVFAATAIDVRFTANTFADNALYGINAHQLSAGLLLAGNTVERSGRDGIMLSDHVTGAVVRDNVTRGNGGNGLMIDSGSSGIAVSGNLAQGNGGDGIAVADSSHVTVTGNRIVDNRVAIDVYATGVARTPGTDNVAKNNVIDGNGAALQGIAGANAVLANGDYWRPWAAAAIGLAAVLLVAGLQVLTRRRRAATAAAVARSQDERVLQRSGALR